MSRFTNTLARVRVAAPCEADWDEMRGDERVRFCHRCSLNVYNLSAMTGREAERLVTRTEGERLCVRFYRRKDGTMLTQPCPVGLRALKRRVSRVGNAIFATVVGFLGGIGVVEARDLYQAEATAQNVVAAPEMPDPPPPPEELYLAAGMMGGGPLNTPFLPAAIIATGVFFVGYPLMKLKERREAKRRAKLRIWGD